MIHECWLFGHDSQPEETSCVIETDRGVIDRLPGEKEESTGKPTNLEKLEEANEEEPWCMALHGNHDEHQCHKKLGHRQRAGGDFDYEHECYCGVWW